MHLDDRQVHSRPWLTSLFSLGQVVLCDGFFGPSVRQTLSPDGLSNNIDDHQLGASILLVALLQAQNTARCKTAF